MQKQKWFVKNRYVFTKKQTNKQQAFNIVKNLCGGCLSDLGISTLGSLLLDEEIKPIWNQFRCLQKHSGT